MLHQQSLLICNLPTQSEVLRCHKFEATTGAHTRIYRSYHAEQLTRIRPGYRQRRINKNSSLFAKILAESQQRQNRLHFLACSDWSRMVPAGLNQPNKWPLQADNIWLLTILRWYKWSGGTPDTRHPEFRSYWASPCRYKFQSRHMAYVYSFVWRFLG